MEDSRLKVSAVFATHNRAGRLGELLASFRRQTLSPDEFEVIPVDDGSNDGTQEVLELAMREGGLRIRPLKLERSLGPAAARNAGWRSARAPLVAFTDDDCVTDPDWLAAGLRGAAAKPEAVLQGRTEPRPDELDRLGPFSRTLRVSTPGLHYQTC